MVRRKKKGNTIGGMLLGPAFKRMLRINEGVCYNRDPKRCEEYRFMLSKKYKEYEKYWMK